MILIKTKLIRLKSYLRFLQIFHLIRHKNRYNDRRKRHRDEEKQRNAWWNISHSRILSYHLCVCVLLPLFTFYHSRRMMKYLSM